MIHFDVSRFFSGLLLNDGIWSSIPDTEMSYPQKGSNDSLAIEENSFWYKHRNECIITLLKQFQIVEPIIDIGGGNGFVTRRIIEEGFQSILLEPGIDAVLNAKNRGLPNIIHSSFEDANPLDNSIPTIAAFDIIEHIRDDQEFADLMYKSLIPKRGKLIATVPAFNLLWSTEDLYGGHYRRYSISSLTNMLKSLGFRIEFCSYFFSAIVFPMFLLKSLPFILGYRPPFKVSKAKSNHNNIMGQKILVPLWNWEVRKLQKQTTIPIGSSCIVVASKI